jgi:hypothetical protein
LEIWWGGIITAFYLGETGDESYIPILEKFQKKVLRLASVGYKPSSTSCSRTSNSEFEVIYFASTYSQRRLNGETSFDILLDIFDSTKYITERRLCMNLIRQFSGITATHREGQIQEFPLKLECEHKRYLSLRREMLKHLGKKVYRIHPRRVILVDGTHPFGPMSKEEVERELEDIKEIVFSKQQEAWRKLKPTLRAKKGVTVLSILQKKRTEIIYDDCRMKMPPYTED